MPTATAPAPAASKPKKPKTPKPATAAPAAASASEQTAAAKKPPAKDAKPKQAEPKDPNNKAAVADAKNPKGEAKGPNKTQPAKNSTAPAKSTANKDHVKSNGTNKDVKQADQKGSEKVPEAATNGKAASPLPLPKTPVSVPVFNALDVEVCARLFENLLDFSPSIGFALANLRPFKNAQHILDQLNGILDSLPTTYLHSFLKRCNELGLIAKTKLTKEQKLCAGLDKLSDSAREELAPLYSEYREKFGFPFVVFARDAKASELPAMIRTHLLNNEEQELLSGLGQLKKIANFRLQEVVSA